MTRGWWKPWRWFAAWSWTERLIALAFWLLPIITLVRDGVGSIWLAGALALLALAVVQLIVWLHGGWGFVGPHFYYDVVRLARRGRSTATRVLYLFAMLAGLTLVYASMPYRRLWSPNDFAKVSEQFAFSLFLVQNLAILVLSPAYLGSAIAEERERRTLELLHTTHLSPTEIILGKLWSRIIHLGGFVLAGFPILGIVQFWGGVDILLVAGNLVNTLLNIVTLGSVCLLFSTLLPTVTRAVLMCYAVLLPVAIGCAGSGLFVLQDARTGGGPLTVQQLGWIVIPHATVTATCLVLAILILRDRGPMPLHPYPRPVRRIPNRRWGETAVSAAHTPETPVEAPPRRPAREPERLDILAVPYTLPPVGDNALMWKECHLGGPALAFSPVLLVPMIPFLATGILLLTIWYLRAWFLNPDDFQAAIQHWFASLFFFYYVFLGAYVLGVAFRATASVARERQQQTLEPLLLLPIDRCEILRAKWIGGLRRGWPWLALLFADIALGTIVGAYHPLSAVLLCLAPWPIIFFFQSLGLLLSIVMSTVLRANLVMVVVLVLFVSFVTSSFGHGHGFLAYPHTFAFTWWGSQFDTAGTSESRLVWAAVLIPFYLFCAWGFWTIARLRFDRSSEFV